MENENDVISNPVRTGAQPTPAPGPVQPAAKQPWDVVVDVYLTKGCPSPQFNLQTTLPVENGNIIFNNNRRPGFNVTFNLIDETGEGYAFPPQPKVQEACWSKVGTTCPTSGSWEVFNPRRVTGGGSSLEVYNDNPTKPGGGGLGEFRYTLRVTKDGGTNYCDLDPGGVDQNGNRA